MEARVSFTAMKWAIGCEVTSSSQKFVLLALSNYASESGKAYPQVSTICKFTQLHDETVRKALDSLEKDGVITDTGKRWGKTQQVKVYQLPDEACDVPPDKTPEKRGLQPGEDPGKAGASIGRRPGEDPAKTPEKRGRTNNQETKERNGEAPARVLTDMWVSGWEARFGGPYKFNGAADGKAAVELVKLYPPERLMEMARKAWDKSATEFNCKHSLTLRGFASRFTEIRGEIGAVNGHSRPAGIPNLHQRTGNL